MPTLSWWRKAPRWFATIASEQSVLRSLRPRARWETTCTRTGRPLERLGPQGSEAGPRRCKATRRTRTLWRSRTAPYYRWTRRTKKSDLRRSLGRKGRGPRRTSFRPTLTRHSAGIECSKDWAVYEEPPSSSLIRGGSRMRESRSYGSVRGAISDGRPYRTT